MITSKQAALLLGTHESTIKRWSNSGALHCDFTQGGHRRFELDAVLDFAKDQGIECGLLQFGEDAEEIWSSIGDLASFTVSESLLGLIRRWLLDAQSGKVSALINTCRLLEIPLSTLFDLVLGRVMVQVGEEWAQGVFEVGEEHRVSECVLDVLYSLHAEISKKQLPSNAPIAVVGAGPAEEHLTGSMMVRITLQNMGWRVVYLGRNVPEIDFILFQRKYNARLVCMSVTSSREPAEVLRTIMTVQTLGQDGFPFELAIGGSGAEAAQALVENVKPLSRLSFFSGITEFEDWIRSLKMIGAKR